MKRSSFREAAPNGGFGVWWFCPPSPALAGNACRWALENSNEPEFILRCFEIENNVVTY